MKISREKLLGSLESVSPGLSQRELIEQSSCFIFKDGRVATFNDEVACSMKSPCSGIEGAVAAKPLLELLSKLSEDMIDVIADGGKFKIKGVGRRAEIVMESEIVLPVDSIEEPDEWIALDDDFLEAVSVVHTVAASGNNANFNLTCVHIGPEVVEACDNFQSVRYPVSTDMKGSCLIRRDAIKHAIALGVNEFFMGDAWMHFRNPSGLMLSCRKWDEEYENLDQIFEGEGSSITLPGGLTEAVDKAKIFSSGNTDNDHIFVKIKDGKLTIRGEGTAGSFEERKKTSFDGNLSFMIAPKLLVEIAKKTNECMVAPGRLKIEAEKFTFVACLGVVE